jgi:hypothetical protein
MARFDEALAALEESGEARIRDGLARYAIATADRVIGVPMAGIQKVGKGWVRAKNERSSEILSARSIIDDLIANRCREQRTGDGRLCHQLLPIAAIHYGPLVVGPTER